MSYILALDQGTTNSRALLLDRDGRIKGVAQREFDSVFRSQAGSSMTPRRSGVRRLASPWKYWASRAFVHAMWP
jgi:glycerol kinase